MVRRSPTVLRNGTNQMCLFWAKNHMDGVLWGAPSQPACGTDCTEICSLWASHTTPFFSRAVRCNTLIG